MRRTRCGSVLWYFHVGIYQDVLLGENKFIEEHRDNKLGYIAGEKCIAMKGLEEKRRWTKNIRTSLYDKFR